MKCHKGALNQDTLDRVLVRPTGRFSQLPLSLPPSRIQLPKERFQNDVIHYSVKGTRSYCLWCKYKKVERKRPVLATIDNNTLSFPKFRTSQTRFKCSVCKVPLCQTACFESFHKKI